MWTVLCSKYLGFFPFSLKAGGKQQLIDVRAT